MKLENEFRVDVPVADAWRVLLDVERIAPCLPGAQLQEVEGDEYRGIVKVKVGPITAQYKGVARITESDDVNHRAVIRAEGRDTRGQGNASATATAVLQPDGDGTRVSIDSDVTITGKVAQFGRGVIASSAMCCRRPVRPPSRTRSPRTARRGRSRPPKPSPSTCCAPRGRLCSSAWSPWPPRWSS